MRILIATGVFPPDVGGPSQYAKNLYDEFEKEGHEVVVARYGIEHQLPIGIRHIVFFFKAFVHLLSSDYAIAMDTFSVGVPTILAARLLRKKVAVRVAGDFLWESYVERSGKLVTLRQFYAALPVLSFKERVILWTTKRALVLSNKLVFSTAWQRDLWVKAYNINIKKTAIVENYFRHLEGKQYEKKNFVWAVRPLKLKNGRLLYRAFAEAKQTYPEIILDDGKYPYEETLKRIQSCYAVILPSISDVSPNLILDAIAYGKPFIITAESGYSERFKDIGLLVDPFSEADMALKIKMLADQSIYEAQKKKVEGYLFEHSYKDIASEYLKIFNAK